MTTGRILYHYHTVMSRKSKSLSEIAPGPTLDIGPEDAKKLGINGAGAMVSVESRRGRIEARARVVDYLQQGLVFMSFHFREAAVNLLTLDTLDPISKIPGYKVCAVKNRKSRRESSRFSSHAARWLSLYREAVTEDSVRKYM